MAFDWNETFRSLNTGLPDDIARLKAAGYYTEAIARIDARLAEDWTSTQNGPNREANPTPQGVQAQRMALLAQREMMRRMPAEYPYTEAQAVARMQSLVRDFTPEEFHALDQAGRMDWRFVEGEKHYQVRFAETLLDTDPAYGARRLEPEPDGSAARARRRAVHQKMVETGSASARITVEAGIGMTDEAFDRALAQAKAEGRNTVHVRAWLPLAAACDSQSDIVVDQVSEPPAHIAPADAPQRTVFWEADLAENRRFTLRYSYTQTARYSDPLSFVPDPVQPDFDTAEEAPHIVFTPYLRALAAQLTAGVDSPAEKAKRIYDYITLNVHYHYQPAYFVLEDIPTRCAADRRGTAASWPSPLSPCAASPGFRPGGRAAFRWGRANAAATTGPCSTSPPGAGCMPTAPTAGRWPGPGRRNSAATTSAIWTPAVWWPTGPLRRPLTRP